MIYILKTQKIFLVKNELFLSYPDASPPPVLHLIGPVILVKHDPPSTRHLVTVGVPLLELEIGRIKKAIECNQF